MAVAKRLLLLCIVSAIVCHACAYDEYKEDEPSYEDKPEGYDDDSYGGYGDYGCPKTVPACVNGHAGETTKAADCKTTATLWCSPVVKDKCCCYKYKPASHVCREAEDVCDVEETCTGTTPTCPTDEVANKTVICRPSDEVCTADAHCNGKDKTCPPNKQTKDGTPCVSEGYEAGLYSEVTDENGKVAVLSDEASVESYKKHGKTVCHRCHAGYCVPFKYSWWAKVDDGKSKYKSYYGKDYDEDKPEHKGYEPGVLCHNKHGHDE